MLIAAFLCFITLVVAWIVASAPTVATESAAAPLIAAPSAGD